MFTIRRFVQVFVFNGRQQNPCKYFATASNSDANTDDKPYPLEGIRVLDLTRIGNNYFALEKYSKNKKLRKQFMYHEFSGWSILHNDFV